MTVNTKASVEQNRMAGILSTVRLDIGQGEE